MVLQLQTIDASTLNTVRKYIKVLFCGDTLQAAETYVETTDFEKLEGREKQLFSEESIIQNICLGYEQYEQYTQCEHNRHSIFLKHINDFFKQLHDDNRSKFTAFNTTVCEIPLRIIETCFHVNENCHFINFVVNNETKQLRIQPDVLNIQQCYLEKTTYNEDEIYSSLCGDTEQITAFMFLYSLSTKVT